MAITDTVNKSPVIDLYHCYHLLKAMWLAYETIGYLLFKTDAMSS